jgi:hypothetical protein
LGLSENAIVTQLSEWIRDVESSGVSTTSSPASIYALVKLQDLLGVRYSTLEVKGIAQYISVSLARDLGMTSKSVQQEINLSDLLGTLSTSRAILKKVSMSKISRFCSAGLISKTTSGAIFSIDIQCALMLHQRKLVSKICQQWGIRSSAPRALLAGTMPDLITTAIENVSCGDIRGLSSALHVFMQDGLPIIQTVGKGQAGLVTEESLFYAIQFQAAMSHIAHPVSVYI